MNERYDNIYIVGAFDRHNYGDLLFPLIVEMVARNKGYSQNIEFFSTIDSTMSKYGAKDTLSLKRLFSRGLNKRDLIVIAGGEILPATWSDIVSYLMPTIFSRILNKLAKLFGEKFTSYLIVRLLHIPSLLPFVYSKSDLQGAGVVYNAVGGSHLKYSSDYIKTLVFEKLREADFISVRDVETKKLLNDNDISNVNLAPDCAVLVSTLFPLDEMKMKVDPSLRDLSSRFSRGYMCFQSSFACLNNNEKLVADQLKNIQRETGLGIILFAIGRATGHSDQQSLRKLSVLLNDGNDKNIFLSESDSIFDIMWIIGNSSIYAGTSLHGAITAFSYDVPVIGLCVSKVNKLKAFLETWVSAKNYKLTEYDSLSNTCVNMFQESKKLDSKFKHQAIKLSLENFDRMFNIKN